MLTNVVFDLIMDHFDVNFQRIFSSISFMTFAANEPLPNSGMCFHVSSEVTFGRKGFVTLFTLKVLDVFMNHLGMNFL